MPSDLVLVTGGGTELVAGRSGGGDSGQAAGCPHPWSRAVLARESVALTVGSMVTARANSEGYRTISEDLSCSCSDCLCLGVTLLTLRHHQAKGHRSNC